MATIGNTPVQFNQPGNLKSVPKELTSTLDASKLKQLSPAQLDALKNLPPEKLATLNNIPIDQIKNLDPNQLRNKVSNLPNSNNYLSQRDKTGLAAKKRLEEQNKKADDAQKSLNDKKGFLKDQVKQTAKDTKNIIAGLLTPVLLSFVRAENIADLLIKKLTKDTKKQLQNKGTLTIDNGVFTFTPSNPGNYSVFKNNFDRRVSNLKKTISTLNASISILTNIIKWLNLSLSVMKIYIKIKIKVLQIRKKTLQTTINSIVPPAVVPGILITQLNTLNTQLDPNIRGTIANTNKKIEIYQAAITSAQLFLSVFKEMLSKIQIKVNQLQFNLIDGSNPTTNTNDLQSTLIGTAISVPDDENYVSDNGKTYILKLVTLPNEQRQYQALDSFSKLKITQTAPSRIKTDAQLLEEIKQILG